MTPVARVAASFRAARAAAEPATHFIAAGNAGVFFVRLLAATGERCRIRILAPGTLWDGQEFSVLAADLMQLPEGAR